ncbi:MAG: NADPH-dependent reductase [Firmicutes bacterium]|nr:NADPH-dependent reductase [Bacillota bacterium]
MKILAISGGTKNGGNDAMCKEALKGAKEQGAEIEFIRLLDLNIKPCTGCTACVQAIQSGRGNMCVLKDDFDWLLDRIFDADGIIYSIPIFEKGATGSFRTIMDRFGPRMDRGHQILATELAKKGGKPVDPRFLQDKVVSFMAVGGSEWCTSVQCDFGIHALTPMWKIINNEVFSWSLGIAADDEKIARAHEIGANIAKAAANIENAEYKGDKGVCPHCHCRNFYITSENTKAICCLCGIEGNIVIVDNQVRFEFPEEQLAHAHDTMEGKFIHANDIKVNTARALEKMKTDAFKKRLEEYKAFITSSLPEK